MTEIDPRPAPLSSADPRAPIDAVTIDAGGRVFAYSAGRGSVIEYDISSGEIVAEDEVEADAEEPALTSAGSDWVLVDESSGDIWRADAASPASLDVTGTVVVGASDAEGTDVYVADASGLVRIPAAGGEAERVYGGDGELGTPAEPIVDDGVAYAAWLPEGAGDGVLWSSAGAERTLDYGDAELEEQRRPVFVGAGDALVLTDARSGWVWSASDGALVPSSQDWSLEDEVVSAPTTTDEEVPEVLDPKPPVAVSDAFGVRPGR